MASAADDVDLSAGTLRAKYLELCRKYGALVERLERRNAQDLAAVRLGTWGLEMHNSALAMVAGQRIQLGNARFSQLMVEARGPWRSEEQPLRAFPDLRSLVLAEAALAGKNGAAGHERRFQHGTLDRTIVLRAEQSRQGKTPVVLVMIEDVTDQVRRDQELHRTREALLQRERLRVLGELAAAAAHDLGNTLRGASFQLSSLRMTKAQSGFDAVEGVARRVEIASQVLAHLHDFARGGTPAVGPVRLARVLEQAIAVADIELHSGAHPVEVITSLPKLPPVRGSAAELSLLFVNLLRNARDAMPEGGSVTIGARRTPQGVQVAVADQGEGIAPEHLPRLFQPFFTTKGGRGSGLGLWLAKGTMDRLGGSIRAANRPRGGALFTLEFPLAEISISPAETSPAAAPAARSGPAAARRRRAPRSARRT